MALILKKNIRTIYWMFFLHSFMIVIAVFVPLLQRHGLGMAQVLQTQALFAFVVAVCEVPSGYLGLFAGPGGEPRPVHGGVLRRAQQNEEVAAIAHDWCPARCLLVISDATGRRRSGRLCHFSMSLTNRYTSIGMYISGFLVPVRANKRDEYQDIAERFREIAKDYGALEQVEAWEVDIKDGKR